MMKIVIGFIMVIMAIIIGIVGWQVKRWLNYSFGYEDQVTVTICKMVKPEYLKNPNNCKPD